MERKSHDIAMTTGESAAGDGSIIPRQFRHRELLLHPESGTAAPRKKLVNLWNHNHFIGGRVEVLLDHPEHGEAILVTAYPEPCHEGILSCRWPERDRHFADDARIRYIMIVNGRSLLMIPVCMPGITADGFSFTAPEQAYLLGRRQAQRHLCREIAAEVVQDGFHAQGYLRNFSALAFSVEVSPETEGSFRWFNADRPANIHLYREQQLIFSGSCRCLRQAADQQNRMMVFAPLADRLSRFPKKRWRNPRVRVLPLPNVSFAHPLLRSEIQIDIKDLSSSGFAVCLTADEDVLMPGMIIPELTMNYAGAMKISCRCQVLYRRESKDGCIRYGFVILDMDVINYDRLSHVVMNVIDPGTHVADEVDADRLWEFLFDSGFIYPGKYDMVHSYRHSLKETYRRLYRDNPEIITQITYQRNGRIYGHASMVRAYERTWMVHHLAARPLGKKRTGLQVLKQIMHYFNGLYRLPSVQMDYMMFYFRPENRFPDHFFGGFARHFKNPRGCSLDLFAYVDYPAPAGLPLPEGWTLGPCTEEDGDAFDRFYLSDSGGLLTDILRVGKKREGGESLAELYGRHGFIRSSEHYSLKQKGILKAVLVVNQSDPGLSLSDFLNGIKILVSDGTGLSGDVLAAAVSRFSSLYRIDKIPLLVYPCQYLETAGVPFRKRYNLWIIDNHYAREYSEYMMDNARLRLRFLLRFLVRKYLRR